MNATAFSNILKTHTNATTFSNIFWKMIMSQRVRTFFDKNENVTSFSNKTKCYSHSVFKHFLKNMIMPQRFLICLFFRTFWCVLMCYYLSCFVLHDSYCSYFVICFYCYCFRMRFIICSLIFLFVLFMVSVCVMCVFVFLYFFKQLISKSRFSKKISNRKSELKCSDHMFCQITCVWFTKAITCSKLSMFPSICALAACNALNHALPSW